MKSISRFILLTAFSFSAYASAGIRIKLASVYVSDQAKALKFYTDTLGFVKKADLQTECGWWLTVASGDDPNGTELSLEPNQHPAAKTFQTELHKGGIPLTSFEVDDVEGEYERLKKLGVVFRKGPTVAGTTVIAIFEDTVGNLIQIHQK
jgi:catechol 2,3-dioxygenase-like lactoylglutathione lyase family enzyme